VRLESPVEGGVVNRMVWWCRECGRTFDLTDEQQAAEVAVGHDCESQDEQQS